MKPLPYAEVDVFTDVPLSGNPVAVVFDADGLSDAQMQAFANWTHLSETTFVLAPTDARADYRLRIFTPNTEFAFAGHPTLGSCHAWLERGGRPRTDGIVRQQCGIGIVDVHRLDDAGALAFVAPATRIEPVEPALLQAVCRALGLAPERVRQARWLDNGGPRWLGLLLDSAATVLALEPDHRALAGLAEVGVVGPHPAGAAAQVEVRAFVASAGIVEDPVTGSLNASLAHWLIAEGVLPARYVAAQGTRLGRAGRVRVERRADGTILIGGRSRLLIEGALAL
jgi:PhzF family phenazine biosynthesis protein